MHGLNIVGRSADMLTSMERRAARGVPDALRALSPDFMDWQYLGRTVGALPQTFWPAVGETYTGKRKTAGQAASNVWIGETAGRLLGHELPLSATDAEICAYAASLAKDCREMTMNCHFTMPELLAGELRRFAALRGVEIDKDMALRGLVARLTDAGFWRRAIRRAFARDVEGAAIELGLVHRRAGVYASDETVARHQQHQARNAKALEQTEAENEEGYRATLAELSAVGISNPNVRRAELMTRIRGFEEFAMEAGHVGMFYTWTLPSRFHARLSISGDQNPKYDGSTPKDGAAFLSGLWAKFRAWLSRQKLFPYGFRVAEPHHDGTPHWHILLFMPAAVAPTVTAKMRSYAWEPDAGELNSEAARDARFKAIAMDPAKGTAAGYISKYVCKNIDGKKSTGESLGADFDEHDGGDAVEGAARVRAWASCWGIRQFQQIGGPGVTIWRELRRIREKEEGAGIQGELFPYWNAADKGLWSAYTKTMGGVAIRRDLRPVQLWREAIQGKKNRYGEDAAPEICGIHFNGAGIETRIHQWTIRRAAPKAGRVSPLTLGPKAPWTRVNNCTRSASRSAWDGIAANMAAWHQAGNREATREIFEQLRTLKGSKNE